MEVTHTMIAGSQWHDTVLSGETWSLTPSFALARYLRDRGVADLVLVLHHTNASETLLIRGDGRIEKPNGQRVAKPKYTGLSALQEFLFTIGVALRARKRFTLYVGVDAFNALSGIVLRKLGLVQTVIFYCIDYADTRFRNPILNWIYHRVDLLSTRHSDYIWNLSDRVNMIRLDLGVPPERTRHVPVGLYMQEEAQPARYTRRLIYFGFLDAYKGVDLAIKTMKTILAQIPDAKLTIMGGGPHLSELTALVRRENLEDVISTLGYVSYEKAAEIFQEGGIGIAPFAPGFISTYSDPEKVKDYIRFGCPVVMTNVPEIHEEIERNGAGIVVRYDMKEFADAVIRLFSDTALYRSCSVNALKMASGYKWDNVYEKAFRDTGLPLLARDRTMS